MLKGKDKTDTIVEQLENEGGVDLFETGDGALHQDSGNYESGTHD